MDQNLKAIKEYYKNNKRFVVSVTIAACILPLLFFVQRHTPYLNWFISLQPVIAFLVIWTLFISMRRNNPVLYYRLFLVVLAVLFVSTLFHQGRISSYLGIFLFIIMTTILYVKQNELGNDKD
jgi:magnesium-transporting ATPase (P-type)